MKPGAHEPLAARPGGAIAWMVHNRVAPNLLMLVLLIGGLFMAQQIKKEVFPDFTLDEVRVNVAYPGASPEEIEQGIVLAVEEAINGIEGVDEIRSTASEGNALVIAELMENADIQKAYQEIKQEIDRITTFPDDAEEPQVNLAMHRRLVQAVVVYGDAGEWVLRELTEQLRDRLLRAVVPADGTGLVIDFEHAEYFLYYDKGGEFNATRLQDKPSNFRVQAVLRFDEFMRRGRPILQQYLHRKRIEHRIYDFF